MSATTLRPLKGSRHHQCFPIVQDLSIPSLDSAFQLQEYISLLIRQDPHDVRRIVTPPKSRIGEDPKGKDRNLLQDDDRYEAIDESCWIYEQLRRLAQDLNHPLITTLQQECSRETCPEMKAGEWLYLCVAHGTGTNMEQCCAIDYILHTVDSATALLNSTRAFPSRITIPQTSHRHFASLARRLGRIFAHAYFQHREAFEQAEAESSLYSRYLALTSLFDLVPGDYLNIPIRYEHIRPTESMNPEIFQPLPRDGDDTQEPSTGRSRTDTMVFAEGFVLPTPQQMEAYNTGHDSEVAGFYEEPEQSSFINVGETGRRPRDYPEHHPVVELEDNVRHQHVLEEHDDNQANPTEDGAAALDAAQAILADAEVVGGDAHGEEEALEPVDRRVEDKDSEEPLSSGVAEVQEQEQQSTNTVTIVEPEAPLGEVSSSEGASQGNRAESGTPPPASDPEPSLPPEGEALDGKENATTVVAEHHREDVTTDGHEAVGEPSGEADVGLSEDPLAELMQENHDETVINESITADA